MKCMGIDPSTWTGIVKIEGDEYVGKLVNFPQLKGYRRLHALGDELDRTLDIWQPDIVVIEHYAYGNANTLVTLVEIGSILRDRLYRKNINWWEVPPTVLKKWVTGKGNAKKEAVAVAVKEKWGYASPSDDIVDAFALAKLGEHIGRNGVTPDLRGVHQAY